MIRISRASAIYLAFAVSLVSCLASSPAIAQSKRTADVAVETQAFIDSVYLGCIPAMEGTQTFANSEVVNNATLRQIPDGERSFLGPSKENHFWTETGVVQVDASNQTYCRVTAYGLPVDQTHAAIAGIVTQGSFEYVELERPQNMPDHARSRAFSKERNDGQINMVVLSGSEPGDPGTLSRFSTVIATVSTRAPN